MRDKIRDIVVQAVAGTKDLTEAIDELDALLDDRQSEQLKCGNNNPPCSPDLKFGVLHCCECEWGE